MARADPAARPARGYEQGQPAAWREQDGDEPADRNAGIRQSGEQSGALVTDKTDVDQQSERLYAPLVLPGRCTPYVRAHRHASTRSDTP